MNTIKNLKVEVKPGKYETQHKHYPFTIMEVDTMFEIEYNYSLLNTLNSRRINFMKLNPNKEFIIQSSRVKNYIKCWRIK
jgi:hypothetical protein